MITRPKTLQECINLSKGIASQLLFWSEWQRQSKRLEAFRNIHAGKRCFLIGNGPSIAKHDLTKLNGEISFVTNYFPTTELISRFTPTYFCFSDWRVLKPTPTTKALNAINRIPDSTISFYPIRLVHELQELTSASKSKNFFLNFVPTNQIWRNQDFSYDVTRAVYCGDTIIIDFCLPLAIFMGIRDIYLLGCETDYSAGYFYSTSDESAETDYHVSHWYRNVTTSYEVVKRKILPLGVTIRNATLGGNLEVFDRVDFENLVF